MPEDCIFQFRAPQNRHPDCQRFVKSRGSGFEGIPTESFSLNGMFLGGSGLRVVVFQGLGV